MIAPIGAVLMASAVIVFAWAYGQYRRPTPAGWTESEGLTVVLVLFMMSLLTFGLGMIVRAVISTESLAMGALETGISGAAFIVAFALVPLLTRPARANQAPVMVVPVFTGTGATMPSPANEPGPTLPVQPAGGKGGKPGKTGRAA